MTVFLVTGFEPFGEHDYNPTQAAVERLREAWQGEGTLVAKVLPVEFEAAAVRMRFLIAEHRPDVVLACGLNASLATPVLETIAYNERTAPIPDNGGFQPRGEEVVAGGEASLGVTLPVAAMIEAASSEGFALELSDDAGRYVCNSTLYTLLDATRSGAIGGFLHMPDDAQRTRAAADARLIEILVRAAFRS